MSKLVIIVLATTILSCTPYQRLFINSEARADFWTDSCDISMLTQLDHKLDSVDYLSLEDPNTLLDELLISSECDYAHQKLFPPRQTDSTIWLFTIRPYQVRDDEVLVGSLYTLFRSVEQDSVLILERRVKAYSQSKEFERGKYVVLTYIINDESNASVKLGKKKYLKSTTVEK